jgi:hypothetical protein
MSTSTDAYTDNQPQDGGKCFQGRFLRTGPRFGVLNRLPPPGLVDRETDDIFVRRLSRCTFRSSLTKIEVIEGDMMVLWRGNGVPIRRGLQRR